jgi:hypothetical protein
MLLTKLRRSAAAALVFMMVGGVGAGLWFHRSQAGQPAQDQAAPDRAAAPARAAQDHPAQGKPAAGPDVIRPGDRLRIIVRGALQDDPIQGVHTVEASGKVALGPLYGRVKLDGLTLEKAEQAVQDHLSKILKSPLVSITRYDAGVGDNDRLRALERRVQDLENEVKLLRTTAEKLQKKSGI